MNHSTRAERQRHARFRAASLSRDKPMHRSNAEPLLYCPGFITNNRLVILLAFEPVANPACGSDPSFLRHEALVEMQRIAEMRVMPYGRSMRARTLYRLLCVKHLLRSADWNVAGRIVFNRDHGPRSHRSGREITQLIKRFHHDASMLLAQGIVPTALLDALIERSA